MGAETRRENDDDDVAVARPSLVAAHRLLRREVRRHRQAGVRIVPADDLEADAAGHQGILRQNRFEILADEGPLLRHVARRGEKDTQRQRGITIRHGGTVPVPVMLRNRHCSPQPI
jgi:hypothetical protein